MNSSLETLGPTATIVFAMGFRGVFLVEGVHNCATVLGKPGCRGLAQEYTLKNCPKEV